MYLCNISEITGSDSSATKNSKWRSNLSQLLTHYSNFSEWLYSDSDVPSPPPEVCVFIVASFILLILWTFSGLFYPLPLLLLSFLYLYFWCFPLIQIFTRHYSLSGCLLSSLEDNQRILWKLINLVVILIITSPPPTKAISWTQNIMLLSILVALSIRYVKTRHTVSDCGGE